MAKQHLAWKRGLERNLTCEEKGFQPSGLKIQVKAQWSNVKKEHSFHIESRSANLSSTQTFYTTYTSPCLHSVA